MTSKYSATKITRAQIGSASLRSSAQVNTIEVSSTQQERSNNGWSSMVDQSIRENEKL